MAEIEVTRQTLRRGIGIEAGLEFFKAYGDLGYIKPTGTPTTDVIPCTDKLFQPDDYWLNSWLYESTGGEERRIAKFIASRHELIPEWPFTTAATAASDNEMEIWDLWPPSQVHRAINQAITGAWRPFPNIVTCESMIIEEDRLEYGIGASDLNGPDTDDDYPAVAELLHLRIETSRNKVSGWITSTSATANAAQDTETSPNTDAGSNYMVSFYEGVGSGQLRQLVAWDSDGIFTWDTEVATEPDTTTRYAIWNPAKGEQFDDWSVLTGVRFDQIENPDKFYLDKTFPGAYGLRFQLKYTAQSSELAADSDVTVVPETYVKYKALSILYASMVGDNRIDRASQAGLASYYDDLAEKYVYDNHRNLPGQTRWTERETCQYAGYSDQIDPLGWLG